MTCVHGVFRAVCAQHGRRVAVAGDDERWTYNQLDSLSRNIAGGLSTAGIGPGSFVPIFEGRSPWFIASALGVLRCGAAYVPIDPGYPLERQRLILGEIHAKIGIGGQCGSPADGLIRLMSATELAGSTPKPEPETDANSPAYVMYTSGSSGRPKGTVIPHRGIVRLVRDTDYADFGPEHVWAVMSSVSFDAATLEIWGGLLNGGCCGVVEDRLPSIDRIAELFSRHRVTDAWLTAALFNAAVEYRTDMFRSMKQVFSGGETESPKHFRRFVEACPGVRLIHGYGPTENTTFSLCHTVTHADVTGGQRIPIGTPIRGTDVLILGEDGQERQRGEAGELVVGGAGVGLGYLNQPDLSRSKFVELQQRPGTWYRTGDLVRQREDGAIMCVGRLDRQIKIRGHRIEPEEVEIVLGSCPLVRGVSVDVVGDTAESRALVGYCATDGSMDAETAKAQIIEWARSRVPSYMVPGEVYIVRELPRTANGKVDRVALDRECRRRADELCTIADASLGLDDWGRALLTIWRELLPGVRIDPETDFFAAGGHSLLVLRMISELRCRTGRVVPPSMMYRERTLTRFAEAARHCRVVEPEPPPPTASGTVDHACGRAQSGILYEWWRDPTGTAYHVFAAFLAEPGFDPQSFHAALARVIAANDALRSVFLMTEEGPRQRFRALVPLESVVRTEPASDWDGTAALPDSILARVREPFDITVGPLIRSHEIPLSGGRHLIVLAMHHAIVDEWSLNLLFQDLEGRATESPKSFAEFIRWEAEHLELSEAARRAERVAATLPATPSMTSAVSVERRTAIECHLHLGLDLTREIGRFATDAGTTPFVVLLAAYAATLAEARGVREPWIVTPFANRGHFELQNVVGYCIDSRLISVPGGIGLTFAELVRRTHELILHEHDPGPVPLEEIVRIARRDTGAAASSLVRYAMTYRVGVMRARSLGGVVGRAVRIPSQAAKFEVLAQFELEGDDLDCRLEGSEGAIGRGELSTFAELLRRTLTFAMQHRHVPLSLCPDRDSSIADMIAGQSDAPAELNAELRASCALAWGRVLGAQASEPNEDFFKVGGTSLGLIRLSAELRRETGRVLDVGSFISEPTLARLPSLLTLHVDPAIITFGGSGSDFVVAAVQGNFAPATACHTFAKNLRSLVPAGYEFLGISTAMFQKAGESFEQITDSLAARLGSHLAGRPFVLTGTSFGGIVAFALAAKLIRRGHSPRQLWLLDSYLPESAFSGSVRKAAAALWLMSHSPLNVAHRVGARLPAVLPSRQHARTPPPDTCGSDHASPQGHAPACAKSDLAERLLRGVNLGRVRADTIVLRSSLPTKPLGCYFRGKTCGWGPLLTGRVRCRAVNVPHSAFMSSPEVIRLFGEDLIRLMGAVGRDDQTQVHACDVPVTAIGDSH